MTTPLRTPPANADVLRILASLAETTVDAGSAPVLVMTVGLPGSGKSTFSRRLAAEVGAVVLESDALRHLLFGRPTFLINESRRLFHAIHEATRGLLQRGQSVIIDSSSLKEQDRRPIYGIAADEGVSLVIVQLRAEESIIFDRLLEREASATREAEYRTAGLRVFRRMRRYQQTLRRDHWQIDTSEAEAAEAAFWRVVAACRANASGNGRRGGST
jgi:predicted kinase